MNKQQTKKALLAFFDCYDLGARAKAVSHNQYQYIGCPGFGVRLNSGHYIKIYPAKEVCYVCIINTSHLVIPNDNFYLKKEFKRLLNHLSVGGKTSIEIFKFYISYIEAMKKDKVPYSYVTFLELVNDITFLQNKSAQEEKHPIFKKLLNENLHLLF